MTDIVLIHPGAVHGIYGALGDELVAVEPPLWPRLIAGYLRDHGHSVAIIDQELERITADYVSLLVAPHCPKIAAICVYGHQPSASTQQMTGARAIAEALKRDHAELTVVMLGNHPSALPIRTLREEPVDYVIDGEGPVSLEMLLDGVEPAKIPGLVWHDGWTVGRNPTAPLLDLDRDLHGRAWDLLPGPSQYRAHNWQCFGELDRRSPYAAIYTSLGCPHKCEFCLAGDTPVNTIYGPVPIAQLVRDGIVEIPVFTLDTETGRGKVATARNIRQYGVDRLVRVHFDDGSYIDCTPDHKLMKFIWKSGPQTPTEAKDLQPGAHVRAINFNDQNDYPYVSFGTNPGGDHIHRLVAEWKLGRLLQEGEVVHHKDHDRQNWSPDNLEILPSHADHAREHNFSARIKNYWQGVQYVGPEPSQKQPNYQRAAFEREAKVKGLRHWWTEPDGSTHMSVEPRDPDAVRGRSAGVWWTTPDGNTYQSHERKSLEDIQGRQGFNAHKYWRGNHRVVRVEQLDGTHPVYCLDVPETGWFYANDVLVKNCMINVFQHVNRYRTRSPEKVVAEMMDLHFVNGVRTFKIVDELFVLNRTHYREVCRLLIESGLGARINFWCYARTDTVNEEDLPLLHAAGCRWLALGIESGSKAVLEAARKGDRTVDVVRTVGAIRAAGINTIGNYIFGLPGDTHETMQLTLDLALLLNTEFANFYCAMAYPGSPLYDRAVLDGWTLPKTWAGYSQHNRHTRPLDTTTVPAAEVLYFRDAAFQHYFTGDRYRRMVKMKFGADTLAHVEKMTEYKLERDLLR